MWNHVPAEAVEVVDAEAAELAAVSVAMNVPPAETLTRQLFALAWLRDVRQMTDPAEPIAAGFIQPAIVNGTDDTGELVRFRYWVLPLKVLATYGSS